MPDVSPVHVYSKAIHAKNDNYLTGHMAYDESGGLLCTLRKNYGGITNRDEAHRIALREALVDVYDNYLPEEVIVHEPDLSHPALEIGRLPHTIRGQTQRRTIEFRRSQQNNCKKLIKALLNQPVGPTWHIEPNPIEKPTSPLTLFTDGSHRYDPDTDTETSTIGFIIVDSDGRIVTVSADELNQPQDSLYAEYTAVKRAIDAVKEVHPTAEVLLKTDNTNLSHVISMTDFEPPSRVQELAEYINEGFRTFNPGRVKEVLREDNPFADALADVAHDTGIEYQPFESIATRSPTKYKYSV